MKEYCGVDFRTVCNAEFWHIGYLHLEETVEHSVSRVWYPVPVIPAVGKLRQEDRELRVSLDYIVRPVSNQPGNKTLDLKPSTVGRETGGSQECMGQPA